MPTTDYLKMKPEDFLFKDSHAWAYEQGESNWNKADRNAKFNFLNDQINRLLGSGASEAFRVQGEEDSRHADALQTLSTAVGKADRPTYTDEIERSLAGKASDIASRQFKSQIAGVRNYLGAAGVTGGGLAAGLGSQATLARLGRVSDVRTQVKIDRARQDVLDAQRGVQNAALLAQEQEKSPSTAWLQFLSGALGYRTLQYGQEKSYFAAKDQAKASKDAGELGLIGGLLQGGLSLLG